MNPFDIGVPCINIANSDLLFEQYRMDLNWGGYEAIITSLPHIEKLGLLQFQLYIEAQTMNQCFVFRNCQNIILI